MGTVASPTFEQVLAGLAERRGQLVATVVAGAQEVRGYAALEPDQAADFAATVTKGLDAVLRAMAEQRRFADDDLTFLWAHIRRRTQAGVGEGDMLAVVRIFQRVLWDGIFALAGDHEAGLAAASMLVRPLIEYVDALSRGVDAAFSEADQAMSMRAGEVRRELVETLLAGCLPAPGPMLAASRRAGLDDHRPLVVITARPVREPAEQDSLLVACLALARAGSGPAEPLAVARADEIVVIRATTAAETSSLASALDAARSRLAERGLPLAIGMSTVRSQLRDVPAAFQEACLAREHNRRRGGVLAMSEMGVADYLILRGGDDTAWRLVPAEVRRFVEEDAANGRVLSDTLLAYVDCNLNVKLAAERLFVHPNTAHYRLARIEQRTGCSVRRLADVLLLAVAIRLARTADR